MCRKKLQNASKKGGWVGNQAMANSNKKSEQSHEPCDLYPHTLAPRLPDVYEKKVLCFFRTSASGKQHF